MSNPSGLTYAITGTRAPSIGRLISTKSAEKLERHIERGDSPTTGATMIESAPRFTTVYTTEAANVPTKLAGLSSGVVASPANSQYASEARSVASPRFAEFA